MAKIAKKFALESGVRIQFENGKTLEAELSKLSDLMIRRLAVHGLSQKLGDSYSGAESIGEAVKSATAVWTTIQNDRWSEGRSSDGGILAEAIARIKGISVDKVAETLADLDDDQKAGLRKNAKVKAMIDLIKGERAKAKLEGSDDEDDLPDFE